MLSKTPRFLLKMALAAPLLAASPAVVDAQNSVTLGIQGVLAQECGELERLVEGAGLRIVRVHGNDLKEMHDCAAKEFITWLETIIKNPQNRFTLGNFKTDIWYEDGMFHFAYIVTVTAAQEASETHRLVDMRGTVRYGRDAKSEALRINREKIPPWRERMKKAYPKMKLWFEPSTIETADPNGIPIFHEAVLVKGAPTQ